MLAKFDEAVAALPPRSELRDQSDVIAHDLDRATIAATSGDVDQAIWIVQQLVTEFEASVRSWLALRRWLVHAGRHGEADVMMGEFIRRFPRNDFAVSRFIAYLYERNHLLAAKGFLLREEVSGGNQSGLRLTATRAAWRLGDVAWLENLAGQ